MLANLRNLLIVVSVSFTANAKPLRVLMIDSGTPTNMGLFSVAGKNIAPDQKSEFSHADAMYQFIVSGNCLNKKCLKASCNNVVVDWCNFWDSSIKEIRPAWYNSCLIRGILGKYDIINMSLSGSVEMPYERLFIGILAEHATVVIAAGNRGMNSRDYPSIYSTSKSGPIIAVSAVDKKGIRLPSSNKDALTVDFLGSSYYYNTSSDRWVLSEGTSVAAAMYTNKLIKNMCSVEKRNYGKTK